MGPRLSVGSSDLLCLFYRCQCWILDRNRAYLTNVIYTRLSGCAVAAVGVEGMVIIDDLIAIGILIHLYFTRQCGGGCGFACAGEEQGRPCLGTTAGADRL